MASWAKVATSACRRLSRLRVRRNEAAVAYTIREVIGTVAGMVGATTALVAAVAKGRCRSGRPDTDG